MVWVTLPEEHTAADAPMQNARRSAAKRPALEEKPPSGQERRPIRPDALLSERRLLLQARRCRAPGSPPGMPNPTSPVSLNLSSSAARHLPSSAVIRLHLPAALNSSSADCSVIAFSRAG